MTDFSDETERIHPGIPGGRETATPHAIVAYCISLIRRVIAINKIEERTSFVITSAVRKAAAIAGAHKLRL